MSRRPDPARDQRIRDLATTGHRNQEIAAIVGISPSGVKVARRRLGLPPAEYTRSRPTHEQIFHTRTQTTDDGHLTWTGTTENGTPVISHTPAAHIAWRLHHGVDPVGHVRRTCDHDGCVLATHLEDATTRNRHRAALRAITGRTSLPDHCTRGHRGQIRLDPDGHPHCATCTRDDKRRGRQQEAA